MRLRPTKLKKGEMWAAAAVWGSRTMRGQRVGLAWREAMRALGEEAAQLESCREMRPVEEAAAALMSVKLEKVRCE